MDSSASSSDEGGDSHAQHVPPSDGNGNGKGNGRELSEEPHPPVSPIASNGREIGEGGEMASDCAANETVDLEEMESPSMDGVPHHKEPLEGEGEEEREGEGQGEGEGVDVGMREIELPLREPRFDSFANCTFTVKVDCSSREEFLLGTYGIRVEVVSVGKEKIIETIRHRKDFLSLRETLLRKYPQYFIPVVPDSKWMKRIFSKNFTTIFEGLLVRFLEKVSLHKSMGYSPIFLGFFEATEDGVYDPKEWEHEPYQPRRDLWNKLRLSLKTVTRKMKADSKADGDCVFWKEMRKDLLHLEKSLEKLYDSERDMESEFGALGDSFLLLGTVDPSLGRMYEPARNAAFSTAMLWRQSQAERYRFISEWLHPASENVRSVQKLFERRDLSRIVRDLDDSDFDKKPDDPHRQELCMYSKVVCQDIEGNTKTETETALEAIQRELLQGTKEFSHLQAKIHRISSKAFSTMAQFIANVPVEGAIPEFLRASKAVSAAVTPPSDRHSDASRKEKEVVDDDDEVDVMDEEDGDEDDEEVDVLDEEDEDENESSDEDGERKRSKSRELVPEM
jgi:hypothetical protein